MKNHMKYGRVTRTINTDTVTAFAWLNSYGTPITLLITLQMSLIAEVWFLHLRTFLTKISFGAKNETLKPCSSLRTNIRTDGRTNTRVVLYIRASLCHSPRVKNGTQDAIAGLGGIARISTPEHHEHFVIPAHILRGF
jgi:hypothetical protein